ncbi:hypothetical protein [Pseudomonas sp. 22 E 5]|nr:hypothetical protein [Pseudomonas sp. 22 E 5]
MERHPVSLQSFSHGHIATALMNAVFLVDVHRVHRQFPAQFAQHGGRLVPGVGGANQQGNVQFAKGLAQVFEVAQPEIDFAGRIIMVQPLLRRDQVHGDNRAALAGGGEGGVVVQAQVGAQPDQMHLDNSTLDQ